jgi:hypothetical protein
MPEDASRDAAERPASYDFDLATAVAPGADGHGYGATVDAGWTVDGRPNGGYLLALATRAALVEAGRPDPLAVSAHYLISGTHRVGHARPTGVRRDGEQGGHLARIVTRGPCRGLRAP